MRLLQCDNAGNYTLTQYLTPDEIPPYAILSHTWGSDEVTFGDLADTQDRWYQKAGFAKIRFCAEQARRDGLQYFWVDTCCINKSNSAELVETINYMFRWYRAAEVCYVYLSDVSSSVAVGAQDGAAAWETAFRASRWFTRGWTLLELVAPTTVKFYSREKTWLGDKQSLEHQLRDITGIPESALRGTPLSDFTIAEREAWASNRETTREEDMAYSLIGIFGVVMPLVYGEGRQNARRRLRLEVARAGGWAIDDVSIPFSLSDVPDIQHFVARKKELTEMWKRLRPDGRRHVVILHGLGGIGKTQLAVTYAKRYRYEYSAILWFNIKDETSIQQSFAKVAKQILQQHPNASRLSALDLQQDHKKVAEAVKAWLDLPGNTGWLLVYDNYDNPKLENGIDNEGIDIDQFLPKASQGSIIITTRSEQVDLGHHIQVKKLESIHDNREKGVEEGRDDLEDEFLWDNMSTTSTLVQSSADEAVNPALSHIISFFQDDPSLFPILHAAMQRPGVGLDRFRRILIGILRFFAVELAQEAEDKNQQSSANFIRKYRLIIGSTITAITARVAEAALKPIELEQVSLGDENVRLDVLEDANGDGILDQEREELDDSEDDDRAENHVEVNVQFEDVTTFIRSSKAFEQMFKRLADLAYPSFRSRATECAEKWLRSKLRESDDHEHWYAMRSRMYLIISELHYSKPESLFIDERDKLSQFERFQLKLESLTGESWNWWPWTRPRPGLGEGESRLGWTCSCGDARWEAVPDDFAQCLALLARKYPLTNSSPQPTIPAPTWNQTVQTSSPPGKSSTSNGLPNMPDPNSSRTMANSPLPVLNQTGSQGPVAARFIFLVAKFGRYTLDELPSLYLDTAGFGTELRSVYLKRKGFCLSKLSPYGFSHCDFAKFEKFRRNAYAHRGYSLPDLRLKQYFYSPTSFEPPISPEEFKDIFQHVSRRQSRIWASLPFYKTDGDDLATDTVNRIPQRLWNFNKGANEREDFWGIYICERRSAFMTCLYIVLSLTPFIGFSLLYSLRLISGDIQNATTPLALSLTALGLFLGSIIK